MVLPFKEMMIEMDYEDVKQGIVELIRKAETELPDDVLDKTAHTLSDIEPAKRSLFQVFKIALMNRPKILLQLPTLLGELARF